MEHIDIKNLSFVQFQGWLGENGIRPFRASQVFKWLFGRRVSAFEEMTNLKQSLRQTLADNFILRHPHIAECRISTDGSRKFLLRLHDGRHVECVLIPEKNHHTLCISSQVGCAQGCRFCMTARAGLVRNLSQGEILDQVLVALDSLPEGDGRRLTNIVVMGMGEPLANYRNLTAALDTITDPDHGLGFSSRRVTVSTAGLVPKMGPLGNDTAVNLAVSLNATDNRTRDRLMPINRTWPIETLLAACRDYKLAPRRRITFEYILMRGINDSEEHARQLVKLLAPVRSKINLIPFNPHPASDFEPPDEAVIETFLKILLDRHQTAIIRRSKGADIAAACGQLRANRKEE